MVKESGKLELLVADLQDKLDSCKSEINTLQSTQKKPNNGVSNTAIIQNMKATYDNLKEKTQFQHKTQLCELQLKFKELEVLFENSNEKISRLEEENKDLKGNYRNVTQLKVASLKSELQIQSLQEKNCIR